MNYTDINKNGWIEHYLPDAVKPYAYLARLDRPIGVWLLVLPGWVAICLAAGGIFRMNVQDWNTIGLFGIGAIIMRAAGCIINDLWDRKLDQKVERTQSRPLAAGTINPKNALFFLIILLIAGFLILIQMLPVTVLLGFLVIPLIIIYPLMKRVTWWPQLFLGITFNFSALMGWSAITGIIELPVLIFYLACIFWTLAYDTIYAHQDKEDDDLIGIKSSAIKLGKHSKEWVGKFYIIAVLLTLISFYQAGAGIISLIIVLISVRLAYKAFNNWRPDEKNSSLETFKLNKNLGLLILLSALL
jgi:4-hydroxybenzoate polyprenyltransferase